MAISARQYSLLRSDRGNKGSTPGMSSPRRLFLGATLAASAAALAQQPARPKGPAVWLDLDQAELDAAYDQSVYAPNLRQIQRRYASNSESARQRLGAPERKAYGATPIQTLDIYRTRREN